MAFNYRYMSVLFGVVILFAILWGGLEIYIVVKLIEQPDLAKGIASVATALPTAYGIRLVYKAWENEFIKKPLFTGDALRNCYHDRFSVLSSIPSSDSEKEIGDSTVHLIRAYLRLLEQILNKKVGNNDFEISVFCGRDQPKIVAYYDSSSRIWPSSHEERKKNPNYYIDNQYEVVEVLCNPSTDFIVISDTRDPSHSYNFRNDRQKEHLRSSIIHLVSPEWPAAMVITCNRTGAFSEEDDVLKEVVRGLGAAVMVDLQLALHCFTSP